MAAYSYLSCVQDNKYAGEISLQEIVQLYRDCNADPPMVVHVLHDSPRFFQKYQAIRAMVDAQRGVHEAQGEYDEQEDELAGDEGETVYVDAQEDELDEYDFADDEDVTFDDAPAAVEVEEDELATTEPTELGDAASVGAPDASGDPAAAEGVATDDIIEYEEEEIVVLDTPGVVGGDTIDLTDELDNADGDDQFGVEATIRAAEQQSRGEEPVQRTVDGAEERTTPGKRPREADEEQQQGDEERQVKRKLSVAEGDGSAVPGDQEATDGKVPGQVA